MSAETARQSGDADAILDARGIEVTIDGTEILRGVDLEVRRGEVHVVIGPNGAGKTTFANAITGHVPVTGGTISLSGRALRGSIVQRARGGIGRKFQVPRVFERLTVGENLRLADDASGDAAAGGQSIDVGDPTVGAASLPHGLRQRLEMRMVLGRDPAIAVLDEPTAGMTKQERLELCDIVRAQAGRQTFLIVEHDMDFVEKVADRVSFMSEGAVRMTGTFAEIAADPEVQRAYLGTAHGESEVRVRTGAATGMSGALSVAGLGVQRGNLEVVRGIDLEVPAGRALGVLGRNGAGKTTLLMGLMGLLPCSGSVRLDGLDISGHAAWKRAEEGIALVPQGRQLFADLTVRDNLNLATFGKTGGGREFDVHALFPALERLADRRAGFLSGGEQQQVAIARALLRRPSLLILDEPTEGLAPAIIEEISGVLRFLADEGLTVVLAEQHRSVVEYVCDEFVVLRGGEIAGAGPVDPATIDSYYLTL